MATSGNFYKTGSTVVLNDSVMGDNDHRTGSKRIPRKVLHFSDGIVEEYSTDEEEEEVTEYKKTQAIDPKSLSWMQWLGYQVSTAAFSTLSAADVCGEKLAWFFGITSPKYQYAIDEFNRIKAEEKEDEAWSVRESTASQQRRHGSTSGSFRGGPISTVTMPSIELETTQHNISSAPLSYANYLGPFRGSTETIQCTSVVPEVHAPTSSSFPV